MKLTAFLCLRATPQWLAMERGKRSSLAEAALASAIGSSPISFRFFDAEAFSSRISDVAMIETETLEDYYFFIERLRDSELLSVPYFDVVEIIPAIENGYQTFEASERSNAA